MKKIYTLLFLIPLSLLAQDFNYSPAINRNLEMLFDNYLIDYNKMVNIDPNTNPLDTFGVVEIYRNGIGHYTAGREFSNDTLVSNWICSSMANKNIVGIQDLARGSVIQRDEIHFDANGNDTLIEIYAETSTPGSLTKIQDFKLFYNSYGLDSAAIIDGAGGFGNEVFYSFRRNATGKLDSLVAAITFAGSAYPIQTLIYFENANGDLDSINLLNNLTGVIEEQVRAKSDANGKIYEFSLYERDMNNEWSIYDTYVLSTESFFNMVENAQAFDFEIYPNPAQKEIRLDVNQPGAYKLYHLSGTLFNSGEYVAGESIQIESLPEGVYVLYLELNDGSRSTKRFVKN